MRSIEAFLAQKRETTIHTVAGYVRQYVGECWQRVYEEQQTELVQLYDRAGEWAYGVYTRALYRPLRDELQRAGFRCQPDFPGEFSSSIEHWGPPEERERCLWCVVQDGQGQTLGTIVTRLFHDHTRFRLPYAPGVLVLSQTDDQSIVAALSDPSHRRPPKEDSPASTYRPSDGRNLTGWEYSVELGLGDCLDPARLELSESLLDLALARWGRHGWELVSVVPQAGRLIAFFRRAAARGQQAKTGSPSDG